MHLSLLGSVELLGAGTAGTGPPSGRQRQLLAALGSRPGEVVAADQLVEWLWGHEGPADPAAALRTVVSRTRRLLEPPLTIETTDLGYRLRCPPDHLDVARFVDLVEAARIAAPADAEQATRHALGLWRGEPFGGLDHVDLLEARARLGALRVEAIETRIEALTDLGRHREAIALAEPHVRAHPERERPVAALMRCLFAAGRQSDALEHYRALRRRLVDTLGVEPSAELAALELAVLRQDPDLAGPGRSVAAEGVGQAVRFCRTADGTQIALAISGEGPPLVKAANWMTHLDHDGRSPVWSHWLEALAAEHRLVRYDERGCGLSDWDVDRFDLDAWVEDLATVVDTVGLRRFPLLGISQGAAVAIAYAAANPERVERIVLWGAYGLGRLARADTPEARQEARLHAELARVGWGNDDPAFRQVFTSQFMPDGTLEQWADFNDLQRRTTSASNAARFLEAFAEIDVLDQAARVECPVLVLHARDELRVPVEAARELAAALPDGRLVTLPGRNHILSADEPAWPLFLAEVRAFLAAPT